MPFVKLDCGILDSTLWIDREAREVFITALLMAIPIQLKQPSAQIEIREIKETGFSAPPGWYGLVEAASLGIIRRAGLDHKAGLDALERLGKPDSESRTPDHEGRRMIRIDGGFLILNYDRYRQKDYTAAKRMRDFRDRKASSVTALRVTSRNVTQAEAEAEKREERGSARPPYEGDAVIPTWDEFKVAFMADAIPEDYLRRQFDHFENNQLWLNKFNRLVKWQVIVRGRWADDQKPGLNSGRHGTPNGAQLVVWQQELERVLEKMKSLKRQYADHQTWTAEDKTEFSKLKARRDELKKNLGVVV